MDNQLSDITKKYLSRFYEILDIMIQRMTSVKTTNSISHNFILQMIPHHEAAIEMSRNLLQYTTNIELQNIALNIISNQTESIEAMLRAFERCSTVMNTNTDGLVYQNAFDEVTERMFNNMANSPVSNNIDINFINEMIPHHIGAIEMSRNAMRFNICVELTNILRNIIVLQSQGVQQMRALLEQIEMS